MSTTQDLQSLRGRPATLRDHPEEDPHRAVDAVDVALLGELPVTPPAEKDAFLADCLRTLHAPFQKQQP
jgi:hypothetical protein